MASQGQQPRVPDFAAMKHHDFAELVLYVDPDDLNSVRAMTSAAGNAAVYVQSICELPRPLPPWLNGVPTLVNKASRQAYRGTACLDALDEKGRSNWAGVTGASGGASSGFIGGFDTGASMACGSTSTFLEPDTNPTGHEHDARHPVQASSNRVGQSEVEAYMRRRE